MLQLQEGVVGIFMAPTCFGNDGAFLNELVEVVSQGVSDVVELEMGIFHTEGEVAIVLVVQGIAVVALQLDADVLLGAADVAEDSRLCK